MMLLPFSMKYVRGKIFLQRLPSLTVSDETQVSKVK